jgi:AcrR family transcriptional regulator
MEETGHAEVSLRAIARRAGVSHAAPGALFSDKAGLLEAAAVAGFGHLAAEVLAAVESSSERSARARLVAAGRAYVAFAVAHPAWFELMWRHELGGGALVGARNGAYALLTDLVNGAAAEGWFPDEVDRAVQLAWSTAHGLASLSVSGRGPAPGEDLDVAGVLELLASAGR